MYTPVALILGSDIPLDASLAGKFYSAGNAVVLTGTCEEMLATAHSKLWCSDWIKPSVVAKRNSASGIKSAEVAIKEFSQINWVVSLAEIDLDNLDSQSSGPTAFLESQLNGPLDEAISAARLANQGCLLSFSVMLKNDAGSGYGILEGELRRWLRLKVKTHQAKLRERQIEFRSMVWGTPFRDTDDQIVAEMVFNLNMGLGRVTCPQESGPF